MTALPSGVRVELTKEVLVAIDNLTEGAATPEITGSQLWQWVANGADSDSVALLSVPAMRLLRD